MNSKKFVSVAICLFALMGLFGSSGAWATVRHVPLGSGTPSYPTVQAAIAAAVGGDEIYVHPGTYTETGQIVIDKDLWIYGDDLSLATIKKAEDTGDPGSGDGRAWFLVAPGVNLEFSYLTLDGAGRNICIAILSNADWIWVHDCKIKNIGWQGGGPPNYYGRGICVYAGGGNQVTHNWFENIGRIGVFTFGTGVLTNITDCRYTGKGVGDWLDYAFEAGGGAEIAVYCNTISNCRGVASSDGSTSAGLLGTTYYGAGTALSAEWNTIYDCTEAAGIGYDAADATLGVIRNNNLAGNDKAISNSNPTNIVNAPLNWYGTNTPTGVAAQVDAGVDYSPWLDSGTDVDPSDTTCFTPDLSKLWVDDDSPMFYPALGIIQEGIDFVSGSTVYVAPGTYQLANDSPIKVYKPVALIGDTISPSNVVVKAPLNGAFQGRASCFVLSHTSGSVVIKGFTIKDAPMLGGTNQNAGIWVGHTGDTQVWPVDNVTIENNLIDNCATGINMDANHNITIKNNVIKNSPRPTGTWTGTGIVVYNRGQWRTCYNVLIENNTIQDNARAGITIENADPPPPPWGPGGTLNTSLWYDIQTTIRRNVVSNNGGDFSDVGSGVLMRGIQAFTNFTGVTIEENDISGHVSDPSKPANSAGLHVSACKDFQILKNDVYDNHFGIRMEGTVPAPGATTGHVVNDNLLQNNIQNLRVLGAAGGATNNKFVVSTNTFPSVPTLNIANTGAAVFNASGNYYGDTDPTVFVSTFTANLVDYTPWLGGGTVLDPGFQGDFSSLWVDDDSPQTGTSGRIQEGVSLLSGSTLNVLAGTYAEGVDVNKFCAIQSVSGSTLTTINGTGTARVTTLGNPCAVNFAIPNASGAMILDGFTIRGTTSGQLGVLVNGRADIVGLNGPQGVNSSFEIKNCVFDGLAVDGAAIVTEQINLANGCSGIIRNNEIKNSGAGVRISNSSSCTVLESYIHDNKNYGVFVTKNTALSGIGVPAQTCENNVIQSNRIIDNGGLAPAAQAYGALFGRDPANPGNPPLGRNNSFVNNIVTGNDYLGLFVHLQNTDAGATTISGNKFSGNAKYATTHPAGGVYIVGSNNVSMTGNWSGRNLSHGLTIDANATGNVITSNHFIGNTGYGMNVIGGAFSNQIYGNILMCQTTNAKDDGSNNVWDNGTDTGNFWDDWSLNTGYPIQYNVSGTAGSIDHYPEAPSVVWVDDDWAGTVCGDSIGGYLFGYDAFAHVQDGVNGVTVGGMVNVYPGTYDSRHFDCSWSPNCSCSDTLAPALIVYKDGITVKALDPNPANTVIQSTHTCWSNAIAVENSTRRGVTGISGWTPNASVIVAKNTTIEGFTFHRPFNCPNIYDCFYNTAGVMIGGKGAGYDDFLGRTYGNIVRNNVFEDVWHGVYIWRSSYNRILNNTVKALGDGTQHWAGISIYDGSEDVTADTLKQSRHNQINGNHLADKGIAVGSWPGLTVNSNTAIEDDTCTSIGITYSNSNDFMVKRNHVSGSTGSGIWTYACGLTYMQISANTVTACVTGLRLEGLDANSVVTNNFLTGNSGNGIRVLSGTVGSIYNNDLSGNAALGVENVTASVVNSSGNWWGSNTSGGVVAEVSANVDYTPWLDVGTDTGDPGFWGDFDVLWVNDNSPQTGSTGRIQEGIDLVSGSTVNVLTGTYDDNLVIDKPLTLKGTGRDSVLVYPALSDIGQPNPQDPPTFRSSQMVVVQADNVLIDGFTFDGDSPTLTPVGTLDARNGIISNYTLGNWDSLTVRNCNVRNFYLRGIYASAQTFVNGIYFAHNRVNNVKGVSYQSAGIMLWGGQGSVDSNVCTDISMGIFLHAGSYGMVRFNEADSCELGIGVNGNSNSTNLYLNRVTNSDQGIQTIAVNAPVLLAGDSIKSCSYGLVLYGLGSNTTDMQFSTIDGMGAPWSVGVYASTDVSPWGIGDVKSYLMRNVIINNWLGIVLSEPFGDTTKNVLVDIGANPAGYNLIYDNDSSELYLENCNNDINATYNYWGKCLISQIEQEIYHQVDNSSLGLVDFSMPYLLGDVNIDRKIDLGDVVYLINFLYKSGPAPYILILGDTNRDGAVELGDLVLLISFLYQGGSPPTEFLEMAKVSMTKDRASSPLPVSAPMK